MARRLDDFPADVKRDLANRAGNRCSNPDCRRGTSAPLAGGLKAQNLGTAAHICAASKLGPRYDPKQTPEQRRSALNGIWLCRICSTLVDNDTNTYTPKLLLEWKHQAEAEATRGTIELPLTQRRVQQQMATVFSGLPSSQSLPAMTNAHRATEEYLSSLDPRLKVKTSFMGGIPHLELQAVASPVEFKLSVERSDIPAMLKALTEHTKHGRNASVELERLTVKGSPLFDYLSGSGPAKLEVWSPGTPAMVRCLMGERGSAQKTCAAIFSGHAISGTESATISASAFGDVMHWEVHIPLGTAKPAPPELSVTIDLSPWHGKDIRLLADFPALADILCRWHEGWEMTLEVYANERRIATFNEASLDDVALVKQRADRMTYMRNARTVAEHFNKRIEFVHRHPFQTNEFNALARTAAAITGTLTPTTDPFEGDVVFDVEDDSDLLEESGHHEEREFSLVVIPQRAISVFGVVVKVPSVLGLFVGQVVDFCPAEGDASARVTIRRSAETETTYYLAPIYLNGLPAA